MLHAIQGNGHFKSLTLAHLRLGGAVERNRIKRRLREAAEGKGLGAAESQRLESIEVHLDQCWDYLRQRRARRHAGQDPDGAQVRDTATVERYQQ